MHARPPLFCSMQALAQRLHCASCVLHRPGGVLLRQNPTASEISDAKFRAIYSGMRKLPPCVDSADDCGEGQFGKPDPDSGNRCVPCTDQTEGVTNCETCEYNTAASKIRCTKCTGDNYLKTVNDITTCVTECDEGYFGHTAATGGLKTCQSCSGENASLTPATAGVTGCAVCTYASNKVTCTKCEAGKYLKTTSDSTSCVEASGCGPSAFLKDDAETENKYMPCGEAGSGGIADCAECSLFPYK